MTRTLVTIGYGMVGHRLVEEMRRRDPERLWRVVVLGEEARPAYDRVSLSSYFDGRRAADLTLADSGIASDPRVELRLDTGVSTIDRQSRTVTCADGSTIGYDALVLATGSLPFVPPVVGRELPGCFTYRTLDDLTAIERASRANRPGIVVGGGLLGLEAANALRLLGMRPHVVETAEHLLPVQLDRGGGRVLANMVGELGVHVHCGTIVRSVHADRTGRVAEVRLSDDSTLEADLVVFSAGIRPRDELAESCGLERGTRGGFLVDDRCRTADERIWAVGECAAVEGRCYGLVAPGYRMAEVVAEQLTKPGGPTTGFSGYDMSAKLKSLGVDVAGVGDVHGRTEGAMEFVRENREAGTYAKFVLDSDGRTLLGAVLAGDARAYPLLRTLLGRRLPRSPERILDSPELGDRPRAGV
ncbi:nitrite reductase (NADH) large subunit [Actinopolyspora lacussalsi]|nr:nitrite reductase (NADH) large subunit [Actinopolyspora lacussalsi]